MVVLGNRKADTELAGADVIKTWHVQATSSPIAPPASALAIDYLSFFTSDLFAEMSDSCCKTLYFPPGAGERLPMDLDLNGEYAQRIRNFVGNRNTLLFNGGDAKILAFINKYFAYKIKQVPVVSGYKRRESLMVLGDPSTPSSIPEAYALERRVGASYYGGLPNKLAPTKDMVAVDTLSLPGASIIIYNNWPRVPTGTPAFIVRYCQIEDPYEEGGKPMKVEVLDCPEAALRGYDCSCGFINFVGWDWQGSHNNVWESSVENADKLAQTFGLGDKLKAKGPQQLSHLAPMVMTQTNFRQDCRGGDCHFD
mmetsp:Transcript_76754/g.206865  ORF Transcript_76754/g.206865 Transcript_76754/m.206865 type:complete len:310 (+) Transcript_76754:170-1099(+)